MDLNCCISHFQTVSDRTQGRLLMPLGSCLWPRPKGIWRMFWLTSKPYHSPASVEALDELLRQRTGIQMGKDDGLSNLLDSS